MVQLPLGVINLVERGNDNNNKKIKRDSEFAPLNA